MDERAGPLLISRVPPRWWYAADWVGAVVWGLVTLVVVAHESPGRAAFVATPVAAVACSVPIAIRRRWPMLALTTVVAGDLLLQLTAPRALAGGVALVPLALVLYLVAASFRPPRAGLALAVALGTAAALALPDFVHVGGSVLFALVLGTAWTCGYAVGMHRRYTAHLLGQERRLATAELDAARVRVTEERLRIARELHDVVAHSMTVVTVQAGYGRLVVDDQPDVAKAALAAVETAGRTGLVELRRLLGVIRADQVTAPEGAADRAPAPGLADLPNLIDRTAVAGVRVQLKVCGLAVVLEPGVDVSAYRIVQEALTNVVRHAGTETATAQVTYRPDALLIEVNDGGSARAAAGCPRPGHGLVGMRERVTLLGGTLEAGPLTTGGFRVRAEIPLPRNADPRPARRIEPAVVA